MDGVSFSLSLKFKIIQVILLFKNVNDLVIIFEYATEFNFILNLYGLLFEQSLQKFVDELDLNIM